MNDTNESLTQDDNKLIAERRAKLAKRRAEGNAFPNDFRRDSYAQDLQQAHGEKDKPELEGLAMQVKVAGRIIRLRLLNTEKHQLQMQVRSLMQVRQ